MSSTAPEIVRSPVEDRSASRSPGTVHLLYHELTPTNTGYGYALTTGAFQSHLELIRRAKSASDGWFCPEITFDDGHVSDFEQALPMLSASGLTARFFVTVGWIASRPGYMSWQQLRELYAAGNTIGAHGWSHTLLTHCTESELQTELRSARLLLEDKLSAPVTTMSLPGGRFNDNVLKACKAAGYSRVFTSFPAPETTRNGLLTGRLNVRAGAGAEWLENALDPRTGALERLARQQKLKETAQRVLGDRLYHRLWALLNGESAATHVSPDPVP